MCKVVQRLFAVVLISGALLCIGISAFAQGKITVTGTVTDNVGPVPGVGIMVEKTTDGTVTDLDGQYSIQARQGDVLVFTCIGYADVRMVVGRQNVINVILSEDSTVLDEVVVVGYGTQRKESVVGAITSVKGETLVNSGNSNITSAISGKLSGVVTIQTSGQPGQNDAEILVRGVSSFNGNSPLVLVDGVERDFASLDPNEVADISVLKDASATAVFGAKGANGVIIVTTKNGQEGKPKMDVSYSSGFSSPINMARHVDAYTTMSTMKSTHNNTPE